MPEGSRVEQQTTRTNLTTDTISPDADTLRLLVDSTTDYAIFLLDPQGYVASWNVGAQRIKGYTAPEIVGRHFSVFYTEESVQRGWPTHELAEAMRVGRFEDEGWRVRKDGTMFFANVVITALREADGTLRGFAKVTRDISERKAHEQRIERLSRELQGRVVELATTNRELEQKSTENEGFVYSVSHDLRSPLVNLQGFSQELALSSVELATLLDRPDVPDDIRQQAQTLIRGELTESIRFMHDAVKHLARIIDGLLRLSRVGRVEYESEDVDVNVVVSEILAAMHTTVLASGGRIIVRPLPHVKGDRNAIGQIFANVVGNALKSFDPTRDGVVEIFAIDETPPVLAIKDNGIGIPLEYQSRLFQVFQDVHKSQARGEGMGLAIVRRIVERHGGRIWFESSPRVGTTFLFTLEPGGEHGLVGAERPEA
jgi:PAS domain S-box-containing protein